ncbi:PREDICTED: replication factor C subunit 5-like [Priapulus caudatus]|uniref:Replication factor C subunit 5-like n=1 Tax=Priapulus caudatus TaxID=37621 RepID=A0ABM1DY54_PRICU|nr:PREDICTED: replication factor C subunit 5-like [Priapulus caudatus]
MYKPKEFNSMVLELNASDDRGIGIVRGQVLSFASTRTIFKRGFKLVILDEADSMTKDAQNALRRVIEKYTENTRFCIICNYLSKIIPALQSRCTRFRFGPLGEQQMIPRLQHVIAEERVNVTDDGMGALVALAGGDMRRALNVLQSASMAYDVVDEDNVYTCVGHPLQRDVKSIVMWMLNDGFTDAYGSILLISRACEAPYLRRWQDVEYRLQQERVKMQLAALLGAFQVARDMTVKEAVALV